MPKQMNVIVILKQSGEQYIFLWGQNSKSRSALLQQISKFAADPELSFSWWDAQELIERLKRFE